MSPELHAVQNPFVLKPQFRCLENIRDKACCQLNDVCPCLLSSEGDTTGFSLFSNWKCKAYKK